MSTALCIRCNYALFGLDLTVLVSLLDRIFLKLLLIYVLVPLDSLWVQFFADFGTNAIQACLM